MEGAVRYIQLVSGKIPLGFNAENEDEANTSCAEMKMCNILK